MIAAHESMLSELDECREAFRRVFPFGQDGAGAQFCLDYRIRNEPFIARFDWEYLLIARNFDELIERAIPGSEEHWRSPEYAISEKEQCEFLALLPANW